MAPYFRQILTQQDFNCVVPVHLRHSPAKLVARLWHIDRYLPGFVNVNTRIGVFIRRDETHQEIITKHYYGYDLLVNWADTLEWKIHHNEGANLDLTNAFPADPQAPQPQRLYFGRHNPGDGFIYHGQVYEDGKCNFYFDNDILFTSPSFELLEYKQPLYPEPETDVPIPVSP